MDAHNRGLEAQKGALEGSLTNGHRSHHTDKELDPDPQYSKIYGSAFHKKIFLV